MRLVDHSVIASLVLCACGGGPAPKMSEVQSSVFSLSCTFSSCHAGGSAAGELNLEPGKAWASLVNHAASGKPDRTRVVPGDLTASYLVDKLEGRAGIAGASMPPGQQLDASQLQQLKEWITAGAVNDANGRQE
jgi:hypothetical protein